MANKGTKSTRRDESEFGAYLYDAVRPEKKRVKRTVTSKFDFDKQYNFTITFEEYRQMTCKVERDKNQPLYFHLKGNYIALLEKNVVRIEKMNDIVLQKRNTILNREADHKESAIHLRINSDCRNCPPTKKVRYVFIIARKPELGDDTVEVQVKCRGSHNHEESAAQAEPVVLTEIVAESGLDETAAETAPAAANPRASLAAIRSRLAQRPSAVPSTRLTPREQLISNVISTNVARKLSQRLDQILEKLDDLSSRIETIESKIDFIDDVGTNGTGLF